MAQPINFDFDFFGEFCFFELSILKVYVVGWLIRWPQLRIFKGEGYNLEINLFPSLPPIVSKTFCWPKSKKHKNVQRISELWICSSWLQFQKSLHLFTRKQNEADLIEILTLSTSWICTLIIEDFKLIS